MSKIPQGEWSAIAARYEKGESISGIARGYGCTPPAIHYILKRHRQAPATAVRPLTRGQPAGGGSRADRRLRPGADPARTARRQIRALRTVPSAGSRQPAARGGLLSAPRQTRSQARSKASRAAPDAGLGQRIAHPRRGGHRDVSLEFRRGADGRIAGSARASAPGCGGFDAGGGANDDRARSRDCRRRAPRPRPELSAFRARPRRFRKIRLGLNSPTQNQPAINAAIRRERPSPYSCSTPARAQSSSCCEVPPPTPQAPSMTPFLMIGTAPWPMIM